MRNWVSELWQENPSAQSHNWSVTERPESSGCISQDIFARVIPSAALDQRYHRAAAFPCTAACGAEGLALGLSPSRKRAGILARAGSREEKQFRTGKLVFHCQQKDARFTSAITKGLCMEQRCMASSLGVLCQVWAQRHLSHCPQGASGGDGQRCSHGFCLRLRERQRHVLGCLWTCSTKPGAGHSVAAPLLTLGLCASPRLNGKSLWADAAWWNRFSYGQVSACEGWETACYKPKLVWLLLVHAKSNSSFYYTACLASRWQTNMK